MKRKIITGTGIILLLLALPLTFSQTARDYTFYGLPVGTGAAAKLACSFYFVARRTPEQILEEDLVPLDGFLALANIQYNTQQQTVTANMLGLSSRIAQYREGVGCTLLGQGQNLLPPIKIAKTSQPQEQLPSKSASKELDQVVNSMMLLPDTRAVLVLKHGVVVSERYQPGFDQDSMFLSWSMAKSITATAIGVLINQGQLSLQQTALLPQWQNKDQANITLQHLLNMSSGLDFLEKYGPGSDVTNMLFVEPDMAGFAANKSLTYPPGENFYYSTGTSNLLAKIIDNQFSGNTERVYDFIYNQVFSPMGMKNTLIESDASGVLAGGSYIFATARDYARFGQLYLQLSQGSTPDYLPEDWYEFVSTPAKAAEKGQYGGHFWLNRGGAKGFNFPNSPTDVLMARGHNGQLIAIYPSKDAVVVRLGWSTTKKFDYDWAVSSFDKVL